ncbi:hypothetical protein GCM10009661_44580 [Catellatospora chokoriensis]
MPSRALRSVGARREPVSQLEASQHPAATALPLFFCLMHIRALAAGKPVAYYTATLEAHRDQPVVSRWP